MRLGTRCCSFCSFHILCLLQGDRLEDDWVPVEDTRPAEEVEAEARRAEAAHRAVVLEMVGDLPDAGAKTARRKKS